MKRIHQFLKENFREKHGLSDLVKTDQRPRSRESRLSDLHRRVWMHPRVAPRSHDAATLSAYFVRPILIKASSRSHVLQGESSIALTYISFNACALMVDLVDPSPHNRCVLVDTTASDKRSAATYPAFIKLNGNIVPHGENK